MSAITEIYDFYTPLENAVAQVLTAGGLNTYTPITAPEFQKDRPRVEAEIEPASGLGRLLPATNRVNASGYLREQAYSATLNLTVITAADIAIHRAFLAQVQYQADTLAHDVRVSGASPNHILNRVQATGGSVDYTPQDGAFISKLTFEIEFSIKPAAWAALE